jgi:hypothetical protein
MIGFGFPWYPTFETAFFLIAVVFFAVRTNFKKYVSVFFFTHELLDEFLFLFGIEDAPKKNLDFLFFF